MRQTHRKKVPSPRASISNTRQRCIESEHALQVFLVVIVGRAPFPSGLYVALMDAAAVNRLSILAPTPSSDPGEEE
jgi:hypothetical protein